MMNMLKFMISADNRSDKAFQQVTGQLSKVKGVIASVDERVKRMAGSMTKSGAVMSAAITAPASLLAKEALGLYDVQVRAEQLVKSAVASTKGAAGYAAQELFDMASGFQAITTFGDEDILANLTTPLLTFTKIAGPEFERAQMAALNMKTVLGTDLTSAAVQMGKALNDPIAGINSLARAGVQFSDDQKKLIKSLVETGQIAKAQGLILDELDTQFGGQAEAAATVGIAKVTQLNNAIGDVKEMIGAEIAGFLPPLVANVQSAVDAFAGLSPEVKRNIVVLTGIAAAGGPVLALLGAAAFGVSAVAGAVGTLSAVLMANPIALAIGAIAGGAYLIYRNWSGIKSFFSDLWSSVSSSVSAGWDVVSSVLSGMVPDVVKDLWRGLPQFFTGLWSAVSGAIQTGWNAIKSLFAFMYSPEVLIFTPWGAVGAFFIGLGPVVKDAFVQVWTSIKEEVSQWPDRFFEFGKSLVKRLKEGVMSIGQIDMSKVFTGWGPDAKNAQIPGTVGDDLRTGLNTVGGAGTAIGSTLEEETRNYLEINSPSKVFQRIGGFVADGLALGVSEGSSKVTKAVKKVTGDAQKTATVAAHAFAQPLAGAFSVAEMGAGSLLDRLKNLGLQLLDMVANKAFTDFFNLLLQSWGPTKSIGTYLNSPVAGTVVPATTANANGNVISGGRVTAFANGGVVNGPTLFPMSGGSTGLMGEAGPEGIFPLTRVNGKLGIRADGGGQGQASVEVHVHTTDIPVEVESVTQSNGRVDVVLKKAVQSMLRAGDLDKEMQRFGVRARAMGV
jgi:hypothetical protein